jgi:hypothetical protein
MKRRLVVLNGKVSEKDCHIGGLKYKEVGGEFQGLSIWTMKKMKTRS